VEKDQKRKKPTKRNPVKEKPIKRENPTNDVNKMIKKHFVVAYHSLL
jgi:hypothetical protein